MTKSMNGTTETRESVVANPLLPWEVLPQIFDKISQAKNVIRLKAMMFDAETWMSEIMFRIADRLKETPELKVIFDIDSQAIALPTYKKLKERLKELNDQYPNQVEIIYSNEFKPWNVGPFVRLGRDHKKVIEIDEEVFLMGMNLTSDTFSSIDAVAPITDKHLAEVYKQVMSDTTGKYHEFLISKDLRIFLDRGRMFESKILEKACEMVRNAKSTVKVMTQFLPDETFAKELTAAAERGVKVEIVTNDPADMPGIYKAVRLAEKIFRRPDILKSDKVKIIFGDHLPVHGKLLIVDEEEVLVGSHNFITLTKRLGTEEAAIWSSEKPTVQSYINFWYRIEKFLKGDLDSSPKNVAEDSPVGDLVEA